jgi:hypothetical protein
MAKRFSADDAKFEELVLYVASQSEDDPTFSKTKLNKLLFFADFFAYAELGEPITGHRYQKLPRGPAPIAFLPVVQRMEARGDCYWEDRSYFGRNQQRLVAKRGADLSWISDEQRALVDRLIKQLRGLNATEVSDLSHEYPGWQAVGMMEEIPYETIFVLPPRPLTAGELEHARELARTRR